jgi:putative SOS response-associated peptidase YedK
MCGRFSLTADPTQLKQAFPWLELPDNMTPRYNVAPSQPIAVIPNNGENKLDFFVWGLIPSWAKDPKIGYRMINARAETLAEKPSFRFAFKRHRCLIPSDGFYEWKKVPGQKSKTPTYIRLKSGKPFAFAGLWESWHSKDGSIIPSCTIITTEPNEFMRDIHNRMPVILQEENYWKWLQTGEADAPTLQGMLKPYPRDDLTAYAVSKYVNSPANDTAACIKPVA